MEPFDIQYTAHTKSACCFEGYMDLYNLLFSQNENYFVQKRVLYYFFCYKQEIALFLHTFHEQVVNVNHPQVSNL